jgi:hypothetical protein
MCNRRGLTSQTHKIIAELESWRRPSLGLRATRAIQFEGNLLAATKFYLMIYSEVRERRRRTY